MSITINADDTIVTLGDSITSTLYDVWSQFRYATNAYHRVRTGRAPTWVNSGVPSAGMVGSTLSVQFSSGSNYVTYVTQYSPTILISFLGINDAVDAVWNQTNFENGYKTFIDNCRAAAPGLSQILIVGPFLDGETRPDGSNTYDTQIGQCETGASNVATAKSTSFVALHSAWMADTNCASGGPGGRGYTKEGVHPSGCPGPSGVAYPGNGAAWITSQALAQIVMGNRYRVPGTA